MLLFGSIEGMYPTKLFYYFVTIGGQSMGFKLLKMV